MKKKVKTYYLISYGPIFLLLVLLFIIYSKKSNNETFDRNLSFSASNYNFSCKLVRSVFKDFNQTCNETCFEIRKVLRIGNGMVQLIRAIQLAKATGLRHFFYPPGFLMLNKTFKISGIQFEPINDSNNMLNCYHQVLWYPTKELPRVPYEIESEFKDFYNEQFDNITIPDDVLVIHLRSGDIFRWALNNHYGQPPCNYYLEIISMRNWSKVIILSENNYNPCVDIISKKIKTPFVQHDLRHDMSILLNAPNIAFGYGSFQYAIILFSKKLKNIFIFNQSSSRIPDHMNCVPTDDYYQQVCKVWMASPNQLAMMKNPNVFCKSWEFIPKGPKNVRKNIHEYAF